MKPLNPFDVFKKQINAPYQYSTSLLISTKDITLEMIEYLEQNTIQFDYQPRYVQIFIK